MAFEPAKVVSEYKTEIDELETQNDELAKALGKAKVEREWDLGKLKSLDMPNKRDLVDMLYYQPKIMSLYNEKIRVWLSFYL